MNKSIMKKVLGIVGISLAALFLVACSNDEDANATADENSINVGVLQFMEHNSLQAAQDGFINELEKSELSFNFDTMNAQGDQSNLQSMSEQLTSNNDLILAIATPAAQSLATVEQEKPILFTAVTDPVDAGLVQSMEKPETNLTGTSDIVPIEEQIALLVSLIPDGGTVGLAYNSSEANSQIQADLAISALEANGIEVKEGVVTTTNDVQQVVTSLAEDVDGIYIPTDNTLASTMATVGEIAQEYQVPVVAGATDMVEVGGLATYGINYEDLGRQTAQIALRILENGESPSEIEVETSDYLELVVNEEMAEVLGIDPDTITVE